MLEWVGYPGSRELLLNRGESTEKAIPGMGRVAEVQSGSCFRVQRNSSAGHAVVERKHPNPAPGKAMMSGGRIGRVGGSSDHPPGVRHGVNSAEMGKQPLIAFQARDWL